MFHLLCECTRKLSKLLRCHVRGDSENEGDKGRLFLHSDVRKPGGAGGRRGEGERGMEGEMRWTKHYKADRAGAVELKERDVLEVSLAQEDPH